MRRLLAVLALAVLPLLPAAPAAAEAPVAVGWWGSLPAPDVGATDLLLQGGDPGRIVPSEVASGLVDTTPQPTALAAVRFLLAADAVAGDLSIPVATGGQALDTRAYATTDAWQPVQAGARDQAPVPDLDRYVLGELSADGTRLVFPGAGKLATDAGELSLVLVAGAADRVVLHAPAADALQVTAGTTTSVPPCVCAPVAEPPQEVSALPPAGPGSLSRTPVAAVDEPVVAQPSPAPAPAVAQPVARPASVVRADDDRTRLLVLLQGLLLVAFFGLLGAGPLAGLARLTGEEPPGGEQERGVGRFRAVREGRVPRV